MGNKQKEKNNLIELLSTWVTSIKLHNKNGNYDINKHSEIISMKILNVIYDLELTHLEKKLSNHPGIDLGDKTNKIAFQITSRTDADKIRKDLRTCVEREYNKIYSNGINFFILTDNDTEIKFGHNNPNKISSSFDKNKNIITITDISKKIISLCDEDYKKFTAIVQVLNEELGKNNTIIHNTSIEKKSVAPIINFSFENKGYFQISDSDAQIELFLRKISRRYEKDIDPLFEVNITEEEGLAKKYKELEQDSNDIKKQTEALNIEEILDSIGKIKSEIKLKIKQLIIIKISIGYNHYSFNTFVSALKDIIIDLWQTRIIIEESFLTDYLKTDCPPSTVKPLYQQGNTKLDIIIKKYHFAFSIYAPKKEVEALFKKHYPSFVLNSLNAIGSLLYALEVFDLGNDKIIEKVIPSFISKLYHHSKQLPIDEIRLTSLPIGIG